MLIDPTDNQSKRSLIPLAVAILIIIIFALAHYYQSYRKNIEINNQINKIIDVEQARTGRGLNAEIATSTTNATTTPF